MHACKILTKAVCSVLKWVSTHTYRAHVRFLWKIWTMTVKCVKTLLLWYSLSNLFTEQGVARRTPKKWKLNNETLTRWALWFNVTVQFAEILTVNSTSTYNRELNYPTPVPLRTACSWAYCKFHQSWGLGWLLVGQLHSTGRVVQRTSTTISRTYKFLE